MVKIYSLLGILFIFLLAMENFSEVSCIACFKCVSVAGDNPSCEDKFHNNATEGMVELVDVCMGGRKGRDGLFPASDCIKVTGVYVDTGVSMMIRGCALDSGTLTTDTEIIRMSHCGAFYFNDRYVKGCVQSCNDLDGCNAAVKNVTRGTYLMIFLIQMLKLLRMKT